MPKSVIYWLISPVSDFNSNLEIYYCSTESDPFYFHLFFKLLLCQAKSNQLIRVGITGGLSLTQLRDKRQDKQDFNVFIFTFITSAYF